MEISECPITIKYTLQPWNMIQKRSFKFRMNLKDKEDEKGLFYRDGAYLTYFEPNNTRKLLPCFDEPSPRVTYKVTLRIPERLQGVSNMPVESINHINNEKEIIFMKTPPMCAYLLCVCVGPFDSIQSKTKKGLPIKLYALNPHKELLKELLKVATFSVEWMESNFGVNYELPHLQILFHKGYVHFAMENYGLIVCPDESKWIEMRGSFVIAHETIHQWFGDLVSIKWWDSIWLNEGFASFIEYLIMDDYGIVGNIWEDFIKFKAPPSFEFFTKDVISPNPDNIDFENMFNQLLYSKGCYVVKMFYDILGRSDFLTICSKWLIQYKNKSVEIPEFLKLVNNSLNRNFDNFFNPWLKKVGFPFLLVEEVLSPDGNKIGITITQKFTRGSCYIFKVPILYEKNGKSKLMEVMLDELNKTVDVEFDWIIVNYNIGSLCFVGYSDLLINELIEQNKQNKISKCNIYLINVSNTAKHKYGFHTF